jgi:tetratricopeptide (TPR) repeat protein
MAGSCILWRRGTAPFALLTIIAAALPAFPQTPIPQVDLEKALTGLDKAMATLDKPLTGLDKQLTGLDSALAALNMPLVGLDMQIQSLGRGIGRGVGPGFSADYDTGMRQLDERKYEDAIQRFDRVVAAKSDRADGALYWKAYSLNRLGKRDDALAAIAQLRRDYSKSRWLDDAQALEVEVRQNSGKPVSPETESNEELKLIAINGLLSADPDRAVPLLETILKGTAPPRIKDRALFVLAQSRSPRAQQVLADYAKGTANPDMQKRAMQYIGMVRSPEHDQLLSTIYAGTTNPEVKRAVVQALFISRASAKLIELARSEHDPAIKILIVQQLANMHTKESDDYMLELLK